MSIKLGGHIAFGADTKLREGVVVDVSHGGEAMLVAWSDGGQTVIAMESPASLNDVPRHIKFARDTLP